MKDSQYMYLKPNYFDKMEQINKQKQTYKNKNLLPKMN